MELHKSVLLKEFLFYFSNPCPKYHLDMNLGLGGHAKALLLRCEKTFLIGIDKDEDAIDIAIKNLESFKDRIAVYKSSFLNFDNILEREKIEKVDSVFFDLGVSSFQLSSERGFSFSKESFLDMRMDKDSPLDARKVVNTYSQKALEHILKTYGEEKLYKKIAKAIVERRKIKPIETTKELALIVESCYKKGYYKIHPATKTFQAIRIEVNSELSELYDVLKKLPNFLEKGAKVGIISFHSLEDRLVKEFFKENKEMFDILTKKPLVPTEEEIKENKRARSAKFRVGVFK